MVQLRKDIAAAKDKMIWTFLSNREINRLETSLYNDETVDLMAAGRYEEGRGLIVLTNRRVLFIKDGLFSKKSQDFNFYSISSVDWSGRMFLGDIIIYGDGAETVITGITKKLGALMVKEIGSRKISRSQASNQQYSPPAQSGATSSQNEVQLDRIIERLKSLGELRAEGIITEEEFQEQKAYFLKD